MSETLLDMLAIATREKPVCRFEYRLKTGKHEREFRADIKRLRKQGVKVVSDSHSGGYWIAKSDSEYRTFRQQQISRIRSIAEDIRAMDNNTEGQMTLWEEVQNGF